MCDNKQWIQGYFLTGETSENLVLHVENFVFHLIHFFLILEKKKRHWFNVQLFIFFFFYSTEARNMIDTLKARSQSHYTLCL